MRKLLTSNFQLPTGSLGFTLVEAVVATSLFAVTMTSIVGVYLSTQRLNRVAVSMQALQENARFLSETVTKIIRNGSIDYVNCSYASTEQVLCLRDQEGAPIVIRISPSPSTIRITKNGVTSPLTFYNPITGRGVVLTNLRFGVWPETDPFSGGSVQHQPVVRVYSEFESQIFSNVRIRMPFQFIVATRQYP